MMYILAISGKENEGAYALESENNKRMHCLHVQWVI